MNNMCSRHANGKGDTNCAEHRFLFLRLFNDQIFLKHKDFESTPMFVWVRLWCAVFSGFLRFRFIHMTYNYKI